MSCEGLNKISISTCVRTFCRGCETCKSPRFLEIKRNKANLELRKDAVTHQIQELRIQADRALRQIPERSLNLRAIQAQIDQKDKDAAEECGDHRWWPAMRREDHQRSDHGYEWTHWTNVYFRRCACCLKEEIISLETHRWMTDQQSQDRANDDHPNTEQDNERN